VRHEEIPEALWRKASEQLYCSRDAFLAHLAEWKMTVLHVDNAPAFVVLEKGNEFHVDSLGTGKPFPMKAFLREVYRIAGEHGHAITRTPKDTDKQHDVNARLGWTQVGEDDFDIIYRVEKTPRSKACPS